jgi:hypothetical protein
MATIEEKLHSEPYACMRGVEDIVLGMAPEVLSLVTSVIETTLRDAKVDRIDVSSSSEPGDPSGWREVVFTVLVDAPRAQAFEYWYRIEAQVESLEDTLDPAAKQQLAEQVAIRVHPLGAD